MRGLDIEVRCQFQLDARVQLIVLLLAPLSMILNPYQPLPRKGLSSRTNYAHQHIAVQFCALCRTARLPNGNGENITGSDFSRIRPCALRL
jgi:hypothetical protein